MNQIMKRARYHLVTKDPTLAISVTDALKSFRLFTIIKGYTQVSSKSYHLI